MELIKVAGERHLMKDKTTGVVINNDEAGYRAYLAQAELNAAKRQKMQTVEQEIDSMKEDIAEIKNILKLLVEKL